MKEINTPYLIRGISHWAEIDWPIHWLNEEKTRDHEFFFNEFSPKNIIKASGQLYAKIACKLLYWIEQDYLTYLNSDCKKKNITLDDIIVRDSEFLDDILQENFGSHQNLQYPRTYKRLCHYISTCAYWMFDINPSSTSFSTKLIEALGDEYIFIAGHSQNPKFHKTNYNNNIYVITHKDNPHLIDFFTNSKDFGYNTKNPYYSIEKLLNCDEDFISIDMSYLTVDLIYKKNKEIADAYNCGDLYENDDY